MKKKRSLLLITLLFFTASIFASQMWVVGEVFTQTW